MSKKKTDEKAKTDCKKWVAWLKVYGAANFYKAFMRTAQDARSVCDLCKKPIFLDIREGGGIPDWRTIEGDYGCSESTEGCGDHRPLKRAGLYGGPRTTRRTDP